MSAADPATIGGIARDVAGASLWVSHWLALSLAVCLILTMVVKHRIRWPHLILSALFAVWYPLDQWDSSIAVTVGSAVADRPWLVAVVWVAAVTVFVGGIMWLLLDVKRDSGSMRPPFAKRARP
ncbi:hypothetical protein [Bifidobacterium callitrichidarum]|uniref:Uncharacterized protein n=1 Tax=Bifidobacterium callitrichidarum TaxID=2052941 RepID=A0A2U2N8S3_9BIFI|nr:hypothetical protein [Bifidobacterium callitrichidarum]PWG65591.1 hypothetical protein DF196_06555 [Bifidobacterium callitrichidarum]